MGTTRFISSTRSNLNAYIDYQCVSDFSFTRVDFFMMANLCAWWLQIRLNRYTFEAVTGTCIMLHRLSVPHRWKYIELNSGIHSSKMSEVFWEYPELFAHSYLHLSNVRPNFLLSKAKTYHECTKQKGSLLARCIEFVNCMKVRISNWDILERTKNHVIQDTIRCTNYHTRHPPHQMNLSLHSGCLKLKDITTWLFYTRVDGKSCFKICLWLMVINIMLIAMEDINSGYIWWFGLLLWALITLEKHLTLQWALHE